MSKEIHISVRNVHFFSGMRGGGGTGVVFEV